MVVGTGKGVFWRLLWGEGAVLCVLLPEDTWGEGGVPLSSRVGAWVVEGWVLGGWVLGGWVERVKSEGEWMGTEGGMLVRLLWLLCMCCCWC